MERSARPDDTGRSVRGKALGRVLAAWVVLPAFLCATAGELRWWQAWAYCGLLLVPMSVFVAWMALRDPAFLERRFKMREQQQAQRRVQLLGGPLMLAAFVLPGVDRRLHWSDVPPMANGIALALSLLAYLLILRVFLENRWAGRTVEVAAGQSVISTGPYSVVRHPMYSGLLLLLVATPIALGSWWALVPSVAFVPLLVARLVDEERVLGKELVGYEAYRRAVRHRLVPLLW